MSVGTKFQNEASIRCNVTFVRQEEELPVELAGVFAFRRFKSIPLIRVLRVLSRVIARSHQIWDNQALLCALKSHPPSNELISIVEGE